MADILSNLPDNLIDVILMYLPYKNAVKTCLLSKKWRYHWCRLTELTLDDSLWETEEDKLYPTVKFRKIISPILTLHEGPINTFILDVFHLEICPDIDNFICFLSRNGIQHLVLHLPFRKTYKLPSSFFTCSQLRHLNLYCCSIHHPSAFQGFYNLISLVLREVTISSELLQSILSNCPLLEQLVLDISGKIELTEISAPMLRSFDFSGDLSTICLTNVPRLVKLTLVGKYMQAEDFDIAKVFESCSALEHLSFNLYEYEFFANEGYEAPTRLPFNLNSVKRFYLPDILLPESYKLAYALCLMRSFPYLEYLEIRVFDEDDDSDNEEFMEESLELKRLSDMTFNHLGEVKVEYFTGRASEMQLIKLLLANSPVLEKLLIDRQYLDKESHETRLEIFFEVSNFARASPKAEIVFVDLSRS